MRSSLSAEEAQNHVCVCVRVQIHRSNVLHHLCPAKLPPHNYRYVSALLHTLTLVYCHIYNLMAQSTPSVRVDVILVLMRKLRDEMKRE